MRNVQIVKFLPPGRALQVRYGRVTVRAKEYTHPSSQERRKAQLYTELNRTRCTNYNIRK